MLNFESFIHKSFEYAVYGYLFKEYNYTNPISDEDMSIIKGELSTLFGLDSCADVSEEDYNNRNKLNEIRNNCKNKIEAIIRLNED